MYSQGIITGLSTCCGDGTIEVLPIFEGFAVQNGSMKINFGGQDL